MWLNYTLNTSQAHILITVIVIRQCVAMAFPPDIPEAEYYGQIIREIIQDRPYEGLTQNSGHNKNYMFSDASYLRGAEHDPGMPVLKVRNTLNIMRRVTGSRT